MTQILGVILGLAAHAVVRVGCPIAGADRSIRYISTPAYVITAPTHRLSDVIAGRVTHRLSDVIAGHVTW